MGWWEARNGGVIGDPPAELVEELGGAWCRPGEIPTDVRKRIDALYVEGLGRLPTEDDLEALLSSCRPRGF